jgi:hypothetical protein
MSLQAQHCSAWFRCGFGALAVLALALRALIPTGFMVTAVEGHAQLVVCPAGLHRSAHLHPMAGTLHHVAGAEHGAAATHSADQCPYALAGGPGLAGAALEPAQAFFVQLQPVRAAVLATLPAAPPPRHQAPRGPPALV